MLYLTPIFTFFNQLFSAEHKHTVLQTVICVLQYMFCTGTSPVSTTTANTSVYFYTHSMVVYILAYMVPSFKVAYPSSWSHFSQTRSRPASYFSITTITASREKFESEVKYWAALIRRSANMLMTGEMEVLLEDNRKEGRNANMANGQ